MHSFPGGKLDEVRPRCATCQTHLNEFAQTDASLQHAALRETQEELGINPDQIDVLGSIVPEANRRGDMTVWPFVASYHYNSECAGDLI